MFLDFSNNVSKIGQKIKKGKAPVIKPETLYPNPNA